MNLKRRDFLKAGSLGAGGLMLTQFVNQLEAAPKAKPARVLFLCRAMACTRAMCSRRELSFPRRRRNWRIDRWTGTR